MSRKLALLIGNSTYGPGLPPLEKPDADIAALARVLADPAIGGFDEVKPLLDANSDKARREVARFFVGRSPDDLLLLYFSGHGLRNDRGGLYLAVQDTEAELLAATAVPAAFISEEMDNCRSRRQILILDCCYSGAFERGAKGPAANPATAFTGNGLGRFVLTASDSTQLAWEDVAATSKGGLSVFTRHLVAGLESGEADLDGDGFISVDELYDYVYARVVEENPRQTPGKSTSKQQGEIFLARNPVGPKLRTLPAELMQALDHPLATVREGAVRALERYLRGSDAGWAKAARVAAEQARDDDSRRVAMAAAEVLATAVPAATEPAPPPRPAPESQPPPTPTNHEGRHPQKLAHDDDGRGAAKDSEILAAFPALAASIPLSKLAPEPQQEPAPSNERPLSQPAPILSFEHLNTLGAAFPKQVGWIALAVLSLFVVGLIISRTNKRSVDEIEETPAASPWAAAETPSPPDPAQALLSEAKSWPSVLADNFDSAEASTSFLQTELNGVGTYGTYTGLISSGALRMSYTSKSKKGGFDSFLAKTTATNADFYLRVDVRNVQGPTEGDAGLLFRVIDRSPRQFYAFTINQDSYDFGSYTDKWRMLRTWTPSPVIHPGQTNSLAVIGKGSDFILFINGQKVDQISDATLSSGRVGIGVEANGLDPVKFDFDNFELHVRPAVQPSKNP